MITASLINDLQSCGVVFDVEGDDLKVDAPRGILTPAIKAELKQHKSAVIAMIRRPVDHAFFRDMFEERVAMFLHESDWPEEEAVLWAVREVLHAYIEIHHPAIMEDFKRLFFMPGRLN